jgi:hypothetical protein
VWAVFCRLVASKQRIRLCAELDTVCKTWPTLTRSRNRKLVVGCSKGIREVRVRAFSLGFMVLGSRMDVPVLITGMVILPAARQETALQAGRSYSSCLSDGETIHRVDGWPASDILGNSFDVTENHGLRWTEEVENASRMTTPTNLSTARDAARSRSASCGREEAAIHGTASGGNVAAKAIPCSGWLLQVRHRSTLQDCTEAVSASCPHFREPPFGRHYVHVPAPILVASAKGHRQPRTMSPCCRRKSSSFISRLVSAPAVDRVRNQGRLVCWIMPKTGEHRRRIKCGGSRSASWSQKWPVQGSLNPVDTTVHTPELICPVE